VFGLVQRVRRHERDISGPFRDRDS
jgi:hypothetical protein